MGDPQVLISNIIVVFMNGDKFRKIDFFTIIENFQVERMLEFHITLRNIEVLACLLTFPKGFEDQKANWLLC